MEKKKIVGFEGYQRINYLFQAATLSFFINPQLSQFYIKEMKQISEKLVIRL